MAPEQPPPRYVLTDETFAALVRLFMSPANSKWHLPQDEGGYAEATKTTWGRELQFMARPDTLGILTRQEIRPSLVQAFFDGIADRPGKQHSALSALRELDKWAGKRDLLPREITFGVEITKSDDGHIPWSNEQVATAERYARAELAKLITLGAHTGQRCSDLIRMGPTDVESYKGIDGINVRQKKTGRKVWVPISPQLARAMEAWPRRPGPFLLRADSTPWPSSHIVSFTWYKERLQNDALKEHRNAPLVIHGLRGHACVRYSRQGLTDHQIGDLIGMSPQMVSRYTRFSAQQENVVAAVHQLWETGQERSGPRRLKSDR